MKKNILIAIGSFVLGAALFVGLTGTLAANTDNANQGNGPAFGKGPAITDEQRTAIETAVQNGDYNAWKTAMGDIDNQVTQKVNESNFARFAEAEKLMIQSRANMESARSIMEELGIEKGFGKGPGRGMGGPEGKPCQCQNSQNSTDTSTSDQQVQ